MAVGNVRLRGPTTPADLRILRVRCHLIGRVATVLPLREVVLLLLLLLLLLVVILHAGRVMWRRSSSRRGGGGRGRGRCGG